MPPPASRIYDVCTDLLGAVVTHHGGSLPARQYVSAGPPAWDCELLAVWCESTAGMTGDVAADTVQGQAAGAGWAMRTGVFVVSLVRCAAVLNDDGSPPSTTDEEAAATALYEDAQRVLNALVEAFKNDGLGACQSLAFAGWSVLGPEGAYVGGDLRVRVGLSGGL